MGSEGLYMDAPVYGEVNEKGLSELRDRIGDIIDEPQPYVEEATKDAIRHWAHGIGCNNPLYTDETYASEGPYDEIVAPPTFLYATSRIASGYVGGLPGVHAMYAGTDWTWEEPIRRNAQITPKSWLHDVEVKETEFAGRAVKQTYRTEFTDGNDRHYATADSWCFRTERDTAAETKRKYESEDVELAQWDDEDIERFRNHYLQEEPRGAEPRYFEDVSVGDQLDTLLKGPMTVTNVIAFDQGWGGLYVRPHRLLFEMIDKHPALGIRNEYGAPEPPECVHWNQQFAERVGVPAPYDYGPERISWLGHVAHHWMGDGGVLKELYGEVHRHNLLGDVVWCSGEVTDKQTKADANLVDVDLVAHDQRDELSASGSAVIELPSRS